MADEARRARLGAQFDQAEAEGRALADDPVVAEAFERMIVGTRDAARAMLAVGIPSNQLVSGLVGVFVDVIMDVRNGGSTYG